MLSHCTDLDKKLKEMFKCIRSKDSFFLDIAGEDQIFGAGRTFYKKLKKKSTVKRCKKGTSCESDHFILLFCPVVSRIGTDIKAALKSISPKKKVILVVMHHTPDPNYIVADSGIFVEDKKVLRTVDCLFHERQGLLKCTLNKESEKKVLDIIHQYC